MEILDLLINTLESWLSVCDGETTLKFYSLEEAVEAYNEA